MKYPIVVVFAITYLSALTTVNARHKRCLHGNVPTDAKLPRDITPNGYHIYLKPYPEKDTYEGKIQINVTVLHATNEIVLHADEDLNIVSTTVTQLVPSDEELKETANTKRLAPPPKPLDIDSVKKINDKPRFEIILKDEVREGAQLELLLVFNGLLYNESNGGLFHGNYIDPQTKTTKWFVAAHLQLFYARKVFPCFDEPSYKVPVVLTVGRPKEKFVLSNMPLESSEPMVDTADWYWDTFERSPPMSTFSIGLVISEFSSITLNKTVDNRQRYNLTIWSRPDFVSALVNVSEKVHKAIRILEEFWGVPYPLAKLDIVAVPNYQAQRPSNGWGLLLFKESELSGRGSWHITQELVTQWLGSLSTPFFLGDAYINNALVRYVTAYTTLKMDENESFNNWPITILYSIYYEFSKRYPHGKTTAYKQHSTSAKKELLLRMLNYTLGEHTFIQAMQRFMSDRQYKTFFDDDVWDSLTKQGKFDQTLPSYSTVNEIAGSWITQDRLPVVTVTRNYQNNTATLSQRIYLRERPHDVPNQEKFVWWIPVVLIKENHLNFYNTTPYTWMKEEKQIVIDSLPNENQFIIVNPEEIGPFPVNYDTSNWNLLAKYLQTENRLKIPVTTRAKLLHDAWNLAYAGDLNFATALNLTLFLKYEREALAWDPVFTLIDHIGRHIDSSTVHKKFQTYVRLLLTPLYEELGNEPKEGELDSRTHLRSSSKVFLCQAGYKPCIEEAQNAFRKWMEIEKPDEGNPVANQYICPVFKWGTQEEWEFGLQRVINFPTTRKQSERTYLLKTLAGCPNDAMKIERLLNITVLEQNGNFTENDIYLIFSMLTGSANGYTSLFNFLKNNWDAIKIRFAKKPHLWNSLVTSATTVFKTQEGLDMVSELYVQRQNEFGTADFVVEKALKNIKEETKWSNDNLPVIEKWLDDYLKVNDVDNETEKQ